MSNSIIAEALPFHEVEEMKSWETCIVDNSGSFYGGGERKQKDKKPA